MENEPIKQVLPSEQKINGQEEAPNQDVDGSFKNLMITAKSLKVVTDGPLSQMFTAVLNELYKKEVDKETGIAIESQALDVSNAQNLWIASKVVQQTHRDEHIGMLYGVYDHDATLQDVMRISAAIEEMNEEERKVSAIVIVTNERNADSGDTFQNFHYSDVFSRDCSALYRNDNDMATRFYRANNVFARAIKEVAEKKGVKVVASLEEYIQHANGQG